MLTQRIRKRYLTIMEIMIAILLIGIVGGAVAYNLQGSVTKGKEFKTREGISRITSILELELAENRKTGEEIQKQWDQVVRDSPLAGKDTDFILDGWKERYNVKFDQGTSTFKVSSNKLDELDKKKMSTAASK